MLVISWSFCQFMPKNEEEVRAALTAQAASNEEANALCSLASLSIQGNADQKRQRLLGFLSGPVSRRRIGWLDLLLRCHAAGATSYNDLEPADLEVRELDGENDERLPEGSVQLLLDLIERCPDGAASVPSASVLPAVATHPVR